MKNLKTKDLIRKFISYEIIEEIEEKWSWFFSWYKIMKRIRKITSQVVSIEEENWIVTKVLVVNSNSHYINDSFTEVLVEDILEIN